MKPQGGYWFAWNREAQAYENTGIQAKGDVGASFKIIGRYDTLEELQQAVPDGSDVDGVYAIGATEPYSYYAWVVVDGTYQWDNQGQLRGAEGKSAYEVWMEDPTNEGKTEQDYFDWLAPQIVAGNWYIQGEDTGIRAQAFDAQVKEDPANTPDVYRLQITTAAGTFTTPNLKGASGTAVRDIDHVPTEADTSFVYNGNTYTYSIGDEVRYYDADLEEYIFYKLNDIDAEGKALWKESGSGGARFEGEEATVNFYSNQSAGDPNLTGAKVKVTYEGNEYTVTYLGTPLLLQIPKETAYTLTAEDIPGYRTPDVQSYTAERGGQRIVNLYYEAERVTVSASATDGADLSSQTLTVRTADKVLATGKASETLTALVPFGVEYTVEGSMLNGHRLPARQSFTASEVSRAVALSYEYLVQALLIFDTSTVLSANITIEHEAELEEILAKVRRVLGKPAGGKMVVCPLNATNATMFEGGTGATTDGTEGDAFTFFPDLYYRYERLDATHFRYCIHPEKVDETYRRFPASLVGTYKGHVKEGKLYSISGVQPTANLTFDEFKMAAQARGEGYQLIDFAQHSLLAMLLYAQCQTRDIQRVLGSGGASWDVGNTTGMSDPFGTVDTTPETATGYVCGLRLEGIYGCLSEYMDGIYLLDGTWHITDPDGSERTYDAAENPNGWIAHMALEEGPVFDLLPTQTGASGTTQYADITQAVDSFIPLSAARSYYTDTGAAYPDDGIAYLDALNTSYIPSPFYGTRLAWRGEIEWVESVEAFLSMNN